LNILIEKSNEISRVINKFIKKIGEDFERLSLFMRDGFVSRTTNPIENYYRTTMPDSLKRIFKTTHGVLITGYSKGLLDRQHFKKYLTPKDFTTTIIRKA